jgi:hypothetical protein
VKDGEVFFIHEYSILYSKMFKVRETPLPTTLIHAVGTNQEFGMLYHHARMEGQN